MYDKDHYSPSMEKYISRKITVGDIIEKLEYEEGRDCPDTCVLIESQKMGDELPRFNGELPIIFHGDIRFLIEYESPLIKDILSRNVRSWLIDSALIKEDPKEKESTHEYMNIHIFVD